MRTKIGLVVLSAALVASGASGALGFHPGSTCSKSGIPDLTAPGTVDNVTGGQTDAFRLVVPAGGSMYVNLQPLGPFDLDLEVCSSGFNHVCSSHNPAGLEDGCHFPELAVPCPVCVGGSTTYGPSLGPGTYRVMVHHCFSTTSGNDCDYVIPPEVIDPVPLPYLLTIHDAVI